MESANDGFNHRETVNSTFATMSEESPDKAQSPFPCPQGCLCDSQHSQAALPGVGCQEELLSKSDGRCLSVSSPDSAISPARRLFLHTSNSACLSQKETCRNPYHSHAHLFRLLKERMPLSI